MVFLDSCLLATNIFHYLELKKKVKRKPVLCTTRWILIPVRVFTSIECSFLFLDEMNTDSMASGCQQQGDFNFNQPNTTVTQQTPNSGSALDQQNASIRYSTQHPGNNQFVVPARGANLLPVETPGINNPHNRPMGLLQNPEQFLEPPPNLVFNPRFGGTSQGRNSSTVYKKPFKFRPIAPQFNFVANAPPNAVNLNQYNFEFGLSSARQTPASNVFTFAGPPTFKMESGDSVNNVSISWLASLNFCCSSHDFWQLNPSCTLDIICLDSSELEMTLWTPDQAIKNFLYKFLKATCLCELIERVKLSPC